MASTEATPDQQLSSPNLTHWSNAWAANRTAWHLSKLHPAWSKFEDYLAKQTAGSDEDLTQLNDPEQKMVLFPLCGKSVDMTHLAYRNFKVAGIEGIAKAFDEYAAENNTTLTPLGESDIQPYIKYQVKLPSMDANTTTTEPIVDLYLGDFFQLDPSDVSSSRLQFDRVFDRGSLVAIEHCLRKQYVKIINSLLKTNGYWIICSMEFDQTLQSAPPNSLGETDVRELIEYIEKETGDRYKYITLERIDAAEAGLQSRFLKKFGGPMETFVDWVMLLVKQ